MMFSCRYLCANGKPKTKENAEKAGYGIALRDEMIGKKFYMLNYAEVEWIIKCSRSLH
jgi:hypothetical protein